MRQNRQVLEIQFLRGMAILVILLVHAAGDFSKVPVFDENVVARALFYVMFSFGVPLFILISGFVLYNRYGPDVPLSDFYARRFKKVLIPYTIFSVIYIAFAGWENGWYPSRGKMLWMVLTGNSYYHLWFVRLIVQVYLLYPFLARFYRRFEEKGKVTHLLLASLAFQTFTNVGIQLLKGWGMPHVEVLDLFLTVTYFIFYFFLGIYVCRNRKKIGPAVDRFVARWALPGLALYAMAIFIHTHTVLVGLERYGSQEATPSIDKIPITFTRIVTHMTAIIICYQCARFLMKRPGVGSSFVLRIGTLSYGFYLLHILMLNLSILALKQWFSLSHTSVIAFPILYASTVILTYAVTSWIYRMPFSELLLGKTEGGVRRAIRMGSD